MSLFTLPQLDMTCLLSENQPHTPDAASRGFPFLLKTLPAHTGLMQPLTDCHMKCDRAGKQEKLVYPPYMIHHSTG
jgi:hypothetical protein